MSSPQATQTRSLDVHHFGPFVLKNAHQLNLHLTPKIDLHVKCVNLSKTATKKSSDWRRPVGTDDLDLQQQSTRPRQPTLKWRRVTTKEKPSNSTSNKDQAGETLRSKLYTRAEDLASPSNCRPTCSIPILSKIFGQLLFKRLQPTPDANQSTDQASLWPSYSMTDHL